MKTQIDHISVQLIVELTSSTHKDHYFFTDEWNFQIDKYIFKKRNDNELNVSFSFDAVLTRYDDKKHITVQEMPSENTRKFQSEENHLEIVLDLISLSIGCGLRIKPDSYLFSCPISKDNPITNDFPVEKPDTAITEKRYLRLVKNSSRKKGIITALRAYRWSLWNEEPSDRIPKLYSVLEQAYGGGVGGNMVTKEEIKKISKYLESIGITEIRKEVVMNQISRIPSKSPNEVLVEKIDLMNEDGEITEKEKRELFAFWRKGRSIPAHGSILPKRGESIQLLLHGLESTVEALLYSEVRPKLVYYFLFKNGSLKSEFIRNRGKLVGVLGDYSYFAVRNDEIKVYLEHISGEIINHNEVVYFVSANNVSSIDVSHKIEKINPALLKSNLRKLIMKILKKIL